MYYWREGYFKDLNAAAAAANASGKWRDYGTFCLEYERGLRHQAFSTLERFIHTMEREPFAERRTFVSWLMSISYGREGRGMLIPHPLKIRVVEPTLLEWTEIEPACPEPHRWLGGYEHLEKAIEFDPADQIALRELVISLLGRVAYSTHHLPAAYLGSPMVDLETLDRIKAMLPGILSDDDRGAYATEVAEQMTAIREYLRKPS
jgi:hypothetical protein